MYSDIVLSFVWGKVKSKAILGNYNVHHAKHYLTVMLAVARRARRFPTVRLALNAVRCLTRLSDLKLHAVRSTTRGSDLALHGVQSLARPAGSQNPACEAFSGRWKMANISAWAEFGTFHYFVALIQIKNL